MAMGPVGIDSVARYNRTQPTTHTTRSCSIFNFSFCFSFSAVQFQAFMVAWFQFGVWCSALRRSAFGVRRSSFDGSYGIVDLEIISPIPSLCCPSHQANPLTHRNREHIWIERKWMKEDDVLPYPLHTNTYPCSCPCSCRCC